MSRNDDDPPALRRKRRSWVLEANRRIVDESLKDGASIAKVARRHHLNTNQLFTWRRQFGAGLATPQELASILPVTITPDATAEYSAPGSTGQMKIVFAEGDRIIARADVETAALSRVVKAARRLSRCLRASGSGSRRATPTCGAACRAWRFRCKSG